jgi:NitT/TauT family transport system ATP-binding protein
MAAHARRGFVRAAVYISDRIVLLSPRPGRVFRIFHPAIDRGRAPHKIRRDAAYLDTIEEIWQIVRQYLV